MMIHALTMKSTSLAKNLFLFTLLIWSLTACGPDKRTSKNEEKNKAPVEYDLPQIIDKGVLRVITTYSPTGYFIYKGKTMGFEYELFKRLADHLKVSLEVVLARNVDSVIPMLNRGEGDIIALGYTITSDRKEFVDFTDPYLITHQALVQKKPDNWRKMTLDQIDKTLVKDVDRAHRGHDQREKEFLLLQESPGAEQ